MLLSISREIDHSNQLSQGIDRQLSTIQQSLSATNHAVLHQNTAVDCILHLISQTTPPPRREEYVKKTRPERTAAQSQQYTDDHCFRPRTRGSNQEENIQTISVQDKSGIVNGLAGPISLFEGLPSFYPETYATRQHVPNSCLIVVGSAEVSSDGFSKPTCIGYST